jgi:hypothetical protein
MEALTNKLGFAAALLLMGMTALAPLPAAATGTVLIQQPDGSRKTYSGVRIAVWNESMAITSRDGKGTVVFGKASCTLIGDLVRCLPYDATLFQNGQTMHIVLQSGTVWLNPTHANQQLSHSTEQLPPRGILLAVRTKRGTYVTLTGTVDEVHR